MFQDYICIFERLHEKCFGIFSNVPFAYPVFSKIKSPGLKNLRDFRMGIGIPIFEWKNFLLYLEKNNPEKRLLK